MSDISELTSCKNLTLEEAEAGGYTPFERMFIICIVPIITVTGLSTNCIFLRVIYRIPTMRTTTNFYLANMAVADTVLLLVTTLNYLCTYIQSPVNNGYPFRRGGCVTSLLVIYVFSYASVVFLTFVALERYQAVCKPLVYRQRTVGSKPLRTNIKLTVSIWTILLGIVASPVSFVQIKRSCYVWPKEEQFLNYPRVLQMCVWSPWSFVFLDALDICLFFIALIINCLVYLRIVQQLNTRHRSKGQSSAARSHVSRMLCINALVFFTCLAPIQLSNIAEIYNIVRGSNEPFYGSTTDYVLLWIGRVAFLMNSTVNPIIYNASNPEYRKAFRKAIPIKFRRERTETASHTADNTMTLKVQKTNQKNSSN